MSIDLSVHGKGTIRSSLLSRPWGAPKLGDLPLYLSIIWISLRGGDTLGEEIFFPDVEVAVVGKSSGCSMTAKITNSKALLVPDGRRVHGFHKGDVNSSGDKVGSFLIVND